MNSERSNSALELTGAFEIAGIGATRRRGGHGAVSSTLSR
jgi:hypothetical protein